MANLDTLETALQLLTNPEEVPLPESLSTEEKKRLRSQLKGAKAWGLGRKRNVVALGIAEKIQGGQNTGDLALKVYVKKKLPDSALAESQKIPGEVELEILPEPAPTDVREIGIPKLESLTSTLRPTVGGYSISGTRKDGTGTLACMVIKRNDNSGSKFILSNSHVLANSGLGSIGDKIFQPGLKDVSTSGAHVATLDSFAPFKFGAGFDNHIDAAVGKAVDPDLFDPAIFAIGRPQGVRVAVRGMMVQKTGRTTEHTFGKVEDVHFSTSFFYPRPDGSGRGTCRFSNLVQCTRFTEPGDSGSLVLDSDDFAVGLHMAGAQTVSISCPIQAVLDELDVDLVL